MITTELIIEYCIYFAIIVIGVLILGLIKQKNRLPSHQDLKNRLTAWRDGMTQMIENNKKASLSGFEFYKQLTKMLYKLDKIAYDTALLAEKERDMELAEISNVLGNVQEGLAPYKSGKNDDDKEQEAFDLALEGVGKAIRMTDQIILRDKTYRARRKKQNQ